MMNYLRNHIGVFILVFLILTVIAPKLFTLPGLDCFDFSETGQIGDTIGGITAPFWGFLSVLLLYITLKEQQEFNKAQQFINENNELIALESNISTLSNNMTFSICTSNGSNSQPYEGSFYIGKLCKSIYPEHAITRDDFYRLYKSSLEIAELCLLYYNILIKSSLDKNMKESYFHSVKLYSDCICNFFTMYTNKSVNILEVAESIDDENDNIGEQYKDICNKYLERFDDIYKQFTGN